MHTHTIYTYIVYIRYHTSFIQNRELNAPQKQQLIKTIQAITTTFCSPFFSLFFGRGAGGGLVRKDKKILEMCLRNSDNDTRICPQVSGRQVARYNAQKTSSWNRIRLVRYAVNAVEVIEKGEMNSLSKIYVIKENNKYRKIFIKWMETNTVTNRRGV